MIQRIQSVYLALVALCMFTLFFSSIATFLIGNDVFIYSVFGLHHQGKQALPLAVFPTMLLGLNATVFILTLYCVTAYKNRLNQLKFVRLNTLLILFFLVLDVVAFSKAPAAIASYLNIEDTKQLATNYLFGAVTPIIALVLNMLAFKAIKKDEELVRSADRIR